MASSGLLLLVVLTCLTANGQDPCVHWLNEAGPCFIAGDRSPNDRLDRNLELNKPGIPGEVVYGGQTIPLSDVRAKISYVEVLNLMPVADWGSVIVTSGGVGYNYISLHVQSQRSKAYSFSVKVYTIP